MGICCAAASVRGGCCGRSALRHAELKQKFPSIIEYNGGKHNDFTTEELCNEFFDLRGHWTSLVRRSYDTLCARRQVKRGALYIFFIDLACSWNLGKGSARALACIDLKTLPKV